MLTLLTESSEGSKEDSIYLKLEILVDPESELISEPLSSANRQSPETEHPNYDDDGNEFEQKESWNLERQKELSSEGSDSAKKVDPTNEHLTDEKSKQIKDCDLETKKDLSSEGSDSAKEVDPTNKHLTDEKSKQIKDCDLENEKELSSEGSKSTNEEVLPKINFDDSYVCLDCNNRLLFDSDMLSG
jgi:hypothetical protein